MASLKKKICTNLYVMEIFCAKFETDCRIDQHLQVFQKIEQLSAITVYLYPGKKV